MNSLVTQAPWSLVPRLQEDINRLFGSVNQSDSSSATAAWIPSVDIHEYSDRFELYVDLPGVDPKNVELTLQEGVLTLSGERHDIHTKGSGNGNAPQYRRTERDVGRFHRRFVLPESVDSDKVNATGRDGVLTVTVPKQAKALPRRIQIAA
jgi:HSP20 family protein